MFIKAASSWCWLIYLCVCVCGWKSAHIYNVSSLRGSHHTHRHTHTSETLCDLHTRVLRPGNQVLDFRAPTVLRHFSLAPTQVRVTSILRCKIKHYSIILHLKRWVKLKQKHWFVSFDFVLLRVLRLIVAKKLKRHELRSFYEQQRKGWSYSRGSVYFEVATGCWHANFVVTWLSTSFLLWNVRLDPEYRLIDVWKVQTPSADDVSRILTSQTWRSQGSEACVIRLWAVESNSRLERNAIFIPFYD